MLEDSVSAEEQERMESSKKELDRYLGAYPYERYFLFYLFVTFVADFYNTLSVVLLS